ncbi:hypothetical protein [Actinopolymorpha pittospori]
MATIATIWERIQQHAGAEFRTVTGLPFSYQVPGQYLRVTRGASDVNRFLSRTNFERALEMMPAPSPGVLKGRQGASYTWAILMDPRIRQDDW